jgi:catechol 2,3-dioxygenase-like lactoylglutathione lyase family enzyme
VIFTKFDHVHVVSTDIDKSVDFYTNVLGFYLQRRTVVNGTLELAYVGLGETLLEIHRPPRGSSEIPAGANRPFGLTVSDMDAALAYLQEKGVEVVETRDGWTFIGRHALIKDPCGISIELREWKGGDGPTNFDWQPTLPNVTRLA